VIQLLLAGQSDEIPRGLAIGWRKGAQPSPNVPEFLNLLRHVVDRSLRCPNTIRIRLKRTCTLGQRQMDASHLLAAQFVQQIPASVAEGFVRDRLDLDAAVRIQRQKRASI
jgi:hypothetical protein